jgi:hypothetical protein
MKSKLSHTLDPAILSKIVHVMAEEQRPSISNTIEMLLNRGLLSWETDIANKKAIITLKKKK